MCSKKQTHSAQRTVAVIQCTAADLYPSRDPEDYSVAVAQRCGLFHDVVLAVPDLPESGVFDELALRWGVGLVKGAVYDVSERILMACESVNADVIVRLLLKRFYLDTDLVAQMIALLQDQGADYVRLPLDFNYELGADVFTREALFRVGRLISQQQGMDAAARRFSPWRVMDEDKEHFLTVEHTGTPMYPPERVRSIKAKLGRLLAENQGQYGWDFPASAYAFVARQLDPEARVLDIACGQGQGTRRLRESVREVTGVDIDASYIAGARERYGKMPGLRYECGNAEGYLGTEPFDTIVTLHTLEHVGDDQGFLVNCFANLKPGGTLFIEVPLLLRRPLGEPLYPFHHKEYERQELESLVKRAGFVIEQRIGRDRGVYVDVDAAREAILLRCLRPS